jgi:hypothetical protein
MKIAFQKIHLVFSIIFLFLSCVIFYFLYIQIEKNNLSTQEHTVSWQEESTRRAEIKSLDRGIKMIDTEKTELEKHFVYNSNLVPFLNTIEGLGTKSGARTETTSVDLSTDSLSLLVGLKTTGNFESIYKFLLLLENSPYELEILSMNINRDSPDIASKSPSWTAVFRLKLLSFLK